MLHSSILESLERTQNCPEEPRRMYCPSDPLTVILNGSFHAALHHKASNSLLSKETGDRDLSVTSESHHSPLQSCPFAHPRVHSQIQLWDVKHSWVMGSGWEHTWLCRAIPSARTWSCAGGSSCHLPPNVALPLIKVLIQWMTSLNLTKHFYNKPTFKSPVIFAWQSQWCAHTVLTKELLQLLTCPHPEVTQCPKGTSAAEQRYRRTFLKRQGSHPPLFSLGWAMGKQGNQLGGWSLWDALLCNQQREREREREVVHKGKTLPSHQPPALTTLCRSPYSPCWLQISWEIHFLI